MWNLFSQISNSFPRIGKLFSRIRQSVLSDCNLFPQIWEFVLSDCKSFPHITQFNLREQNCLNRGNKLQTREQEMCYLREGINNPWEQILNPKEWIAQFDITIYLCYFFENLHVPSVLSYIPVHKLSISSHIIFSLALK